MASFANTMCTFIDPSGDQQQLPLVPFCKLLLSPAPLINSETLVWVDNEHFGAEWKKTRDCWSDQVSERSELAFWKTSILTMKFAKLL